MSAYTPNMAGKFAADTRTQTVGFSQASCEAEVPAILRMSMAEKYSNAPGSLKVHMQPAHSPMESEATKMSSGLKINIQPANASGMPVKTKSGYVANAAAVADPELLHHIPRLKETLQALDSEMHANTSLDVEKRLQIHERILQLQGQELKKAQQAVEQTAKVVGQMYQTQALHASVHSAAGQRLMATEADVRALKDTSDVHSQLHHVTGAGLLGLKDNVSDLGEHRELHSKLHKECVKKVSDMKQKFMDLDKKSALHKDLHAACGKAVMNLNETVGVIAEKHELHAQVHKCSGQKVLQMEKQMSELSRTSELHTRLHKESNKIMQSGAVGEQVGGDREELRQLRTELDALKLLNTELQTKVDKQTVIQMKTVNLVKELGGKNTGATVSAVDACNSAGNCGDDCRCVKCLATHAQRGHKKSHAMHSQLITELEAGIASSNKPGKKHR